MNVHKSIARVGFLLILSALVFAATTPTAMGQPGAVAALDPLQGLVQYRPADSAEGAWQTVTRVQLVAEGDWIQTDNLGLAEVAFFEGNIVEILPNTRIRIGKFDFADDDSPVITIEQSVGDMRHQIDQVLDAESQYEVHTPSAVITVRGTDFWSGATWQSESDVDVATGIVEIKGVDLAGIIGPPNFIGQNQSLQVMSDGQPGLPGEFDPPDYPPDAPLAPETCGNAICEPGEEALCAVDCQPPATCGNGICELESLEGPVTCEVDCVPALRLTIEGDTGPDEPQATGLPCTIRTSRGDIDLRVGPGFNRGIRGNLPPNMDIPVVGQFTDDQGNLWWKVQPPGYLIAEADRYWVLSDDVEETGDCDLVPDASPSGIVAPRPPAQPTPEPGDTPSPRETPGTPYFISFYADTYSLDYGKCATIYWSVEGIQAVYYQGRGVVGHSESMECPSSDSTYELRVVLMDGTSVYRYVTITVVYTYTPLT